MEALTMWTGPVLDGLAVVLLAAVLWKLGRDPQAAWNEREDRLRAIFDDLRTLVAQSEGLARDLDEKLALREERLRALAGTAETAARERGGAADVASTARAPEAPPAKRQQEEPAALATRVEALADAGTPVEEIARRLGIAPAEVRLLIGLRSARVARRAVAGTAEHADAR